MQFKRRVKPLKRSLREFGFLFLVVFLILALWQFYRGHESFALWLSLAGVLTLAVSLIKPEFLKWPLKIWMSFGHALGYINSRLIFGLIFWVFFVPLAIFFRLMKKDLLRLKINRGNITYWEKPRDSFSQSFRQQF